MKEAMLYEKLADNQVRCNLCAHHCLIGEGKVGICQVRENEGGTLYTLVYGRTISQNVDPVEKKPLYHFYPGSTAYSIATPGCNFRCAWCQNWEISQMPRLEHFIGGYEATPDRVAASAQGAGCRSIAYTYTEPTIFFEYTYDTARLAQAAGLANIYVTNGYMSAEMLATIRGATTIEQNLSGSGFRQLYLKKDWALLTSLLTIKTRSRLSKTPFFRYYCQILARSRWPPSALLPWSRLSSMDKRKLPLRLGIYGTKISVEPMINPRLCELVFYQFKLHQVTTNP